MGEPYTGSAMYIKFGAQVLSTRYRSYNESDEAGLVDKSSGADTRRTYLPTLKDGGASFEFLQDSGGSVVWAAVEAGSTGTLEWGPEGTASGKPKYTVNALVKNRKRDIVFDDVVKITVDFTYNTGTGVVNGSY